MKLIIAGSRHLEIPFDELFKIVDKLGLTNGLEEIVSGGASGIDRCGENMAEGYEYKLKRFPADWTKYGSSAGPRRNRQMAEYADALLLIWDGKSRGSANMKARMLGLKKPLYEIIIGPKQ